MSVDLPTLRNDEDTVQERLTENAYHNILPARYLSEGEDPEDMFVRVGQNIAVAELVYLDDDVMIGPDHIKPNHPRRENLIDEVFGDDYSRVRLNERNAKYVSYDALYPDLDDEKQEFVSEWAEKYTELMSGLDWIPNSPTLMNAGDELQQLSACFVNNPKDDLDNIKETEQEAALIFQSGGGVGYAFTHLRPKGDPVGSTDGVSSGPITFMEDYDVNCGTIAQGGMRRGAQMGIMEVWHPDIIEFIHAKDRDVSLANVLKLNDPDDPTHTSFADALEEARMVLDDHDELPPYLRNAIEGYLSNFNMSVGVTDEFMEAVENDETFVMKNPRTEDPHIVSQETAELWDMFGYDVEVGEVLEVPAREVWRDMMEGAHENGEPGVVFIDNINEDHSFDVDEHPDKRMWATNPCLTGDTLVNTPDGLRYLEDIEVGDEVSTVFGSESVDEIQTFEDREVYEVHLSDGGVVRATDDHRFHVVEDRKGVDTNKPLRDLSEGDYIRLEPTEIENEGSLSEYEHQLRRGILVGDGGYTEKTIANNNRLSISFHADREEYRENVRRLFEDAGYDVGELDESGMGKSVKLWIGDAEQVLDDHNLDPAYSYEKSVDVTEFDSRLAIQGFLDGLLASDGSVSMSSHRPQIRWHTASEELAQNVRNIALNAGMHARIYERDETDRGGTRADGSEIGSDGTHSVFSVHIAGESSREFVEWTRLSDYHPEKGVKIDKLRSEYMLTGGLWKAEVESIELCDEEETVYDLYCSGSDTWVTEGYVNRGCAEQPLMEYEACNLGHINLSTLASEDRTLWSDFDVENLDEGMDAFIDYAVDLEEFHRRVDLGTRFLDNVVTMSDFPIDEITRMVEKHRKIGFGVMGLAQLMIQLGIEYGSEAGNVFTYKIIERINKRVRLQSYELALDRGSFDEIHKSKFDSPDEHSEYVEKYTPFEADSDRIEMRNHKVTTVAPTGTTSMIGNTSAGIEPLYNVAYMKNVTDDIQGEEELVEFDELFVRTLEQNDVDVDAVKREAVDLMQSGEFDGPHDLDTVPDSISDLFVTASDLSGIQHARVQAAAQEYIESGISKTINAPNDATVDDADEAFRYLWKSGGKGVTYYRDGSRETQVLTTEQLENAYESAEDEEDGEVMEDEKSAQNGAQSHNEDSDDMPMNQMDDVQDRLDAVRYRVSTGHGTLHVNIAYRDEPVRPVEVFLNVGNSGGVVQASAEAIGKLISTSLRSGVDPREIRDQLRNIKSSRIAWHDSRQIESLADGVAYVLEQFIEEEMNIDDSDPLPKGVVPVSDEVADQSPDADPLPKGVEKSDEKAATDCPVCGSSNVYVSEGCKTCQECGWSECS